MINTIKARAVLFDGSVVALPVRIENNGMRLRAIPEHEGISDIRYIDLAYDLADANTGDSGYYVLPRGNGSPDDHICCFTGHPDTEIIASDFQLTMFGFTDGISGWCAIVTGYTYDYQLVVRSKDGHYSMFPRFPFENGRPLEPIAVEYHLLTGRDASYSGMGRAYRQYLLCDRGIRPIRDRMNDALDYAKDSLYVRIRMAWKPVPSPIDEQTDENEPPIHVAITFDGVGDLLRQMKAAGVEKAEICLVGWNKSGHDGRWPQCLPVEPLLGGEAALRRLIADAAALGYQITCHTNSTDAYSIADCYSPDIVCINRDGTEARHGINWGGGLPRWVCPDKALEIARTQLPPVAALGFRGLHYIDVISTVGLRPCYSPEHPVTRRQAHDDFLEIARISHALFGGFSSEGGYDHTLPYLDYGLYVSFFDTMNPKLPPLFTKSVPLWQVALHGIVLSNPYTATVNAPIKPRMHQLEVHERGGRPTVYIFSKFKSDGSSWMGTDDLTCSSAEDTAETVRILAELYREFAPMAYLQTLFIENHEELCDGITCTTYEDGTKIIVDRNRGDYRIEH